MSDYFRKRNDELERRFRDAMKAIERFRTYEQGGSGQGGPTAWETVNAIEDALRGEPVTHDYIPWAEKGKGDGR